MLFEIVGAVARTNMRLTSRSQMLARTWGSTAVEREAPRACDLHLPDANDALWRALDVGAPPPTLFRWLCQLRVAPYSYDWLDNGGRRSPRALTPGVEQLALGQRFMKIFELVAFEPDRDITLLMRGARRLFGGLALTYHVSARGARGSRLLVKILVRHPTRAHRVLLPWGDLVMMRRQLLNLRALAERDAG
jgi:hypothetical protein